MPLPDQMQNTGLTVVTNVDMIMGLGLEYQMTTGVGSSSTWPAANRALAYPLYITQPGIVVKLFNENGATVAGNIDIGLYDDNLNKIVSSGAVAQAGTSALQIFDITDTYIDVGRYYIAVSCSLATSTHMRINSSVTECRMFGMLQMATAHPLPTTITGATIATGFVGFCGLTYRTTI